MKAQATYRGVMLALTLATFACSPTPGSHTVEKSTENAKDGKLVLSDEEWKKRLTPEQYRVLRQQGTERPFTGDYWESKEAGVYLCAGCGSELFLSDTKFDSGTGWPSFFQPASSEAVETEADSSLGMTRIEVHCKKCGGHLGHVFPDGPAPTNQRYCINSVSLKLEETEGKGEEN